MANDPKRDARGFEICWSEKPGVLPAGPNCEAGQKVVALIDIQWNVATKVLSSRVTSGSGKLDLIIGDFVDDLLQRHRSRIKMTPYSRADVTG